MTDFAPIDPETENKSAVLILSDPAGGDEALGRVFNSLAAAFDIDQAGHIAAPVPGCRHALARAARLPGPPGPPSPRGLRGDAPHRRRRLVWARRRFRCVRERPFVRVDLIKDKPLTGTSGLPSLRASSTTATRSSRSDDGAPTMQHFLDVTVGDAATHHQRRRGSFENYQWIVDAPPPVELGEVEIDFLSRRDSFYLASVTADGWPYVQHRGGPAGFVKVLDSTHLAWADRTGNRQYITAGNVDRDDRVAIIAVDYPNRARLKLLGRARFDPSPDPAMLEGPGIDGRLEGLVTVAVVAFDWNCPKFITPRYTADEVRTATEPLRARIAELQAQLATHSTPS